MQSSGFYFSPMKVHSRKSAKMHSSRSHVDVCREMVMSKQTVCRPLRNSLIERRRKSKTTAVKDDIAIPEAATTAFPDVVTMQNSCQYHEAPNCERIVYHLHVFE